MVNLTDKGPACIFMASLLFLGPRELLNEALVQSGKWTFFGDTCSGKEQGTTLAADPYPALRVEDVFWGHQACILVCRGFSCLTSAILA